MADLAAGAVLGDRFEVHGIVGRGGQATVWLATDRLRKHRVALKVVHPHLASDPAVRKRLQREVAASAALHTDTALVPYDLHEIDGQLVLSMPFHPGQTLAERVATRGPLTPDEVRALGVRIATALAHAHREGVLHRDVTATNVLVGDRPEDSVLTDFGLSRRQGGTRSTGMLGTAGYAAPEVYDGERADPRSDLYGLGAVLYLAATGRPAFDARDPIGALKQQLAGTFTPVREANPAVPADLADTIEALLRADPAERPQGARAVLDALERKASLPAPVARGRALPEGPFTVLVRERDEDRSRRGRLRAEQGRGRQTVDTEIARWGRHLVGQLRDALGIPAPGEAPTPEQLLVGAVAEEAGLPAQALRPSPVLLQRRFRLVDATDEGTAERLAAAADAAGFRTAVARVGGPANWLEWVAAYFWIPIAVGWVALPTMLRLVGDLAVPMMLAVTLALVAIRGRFGRAAQSVAGTSVAYRADLRDALAPGFAVGSAPVERAISTRGAGLRERVDAALDALDGSVEELRDLPDLARSDLRSTSRDLRARAAELADEVDRIELAVPGAGAPEHEIAALRARLDRLETLARAGERIDRAERTRLQGAIAQHDADLEAAERLEARLAACTAQLLEIASTASRVRRELLSEVGATSADELVRRLQRESKAADDARREAGRRAQAAQRQRG